MTVSTSFLAGALVGTGCTGVGRDEGDGDEESIVDGGTAIVDTVHETAEEARTHAYHSVPAGSAPVVMPLELEDSPTTPPPATALSRKARRAQADAGAADEGDCGEAFDDAADAVSRASRRAVSREVTTDSVRATRRAGRPARDAVGESFIPPSTRSYLQPGRGY